ncbi:MAG: CHRD domain-containing protein, partial [Pirellulales bacterium]|nr:CHRD domain-containing protein [Pirellulales bacterium]
HFTAALSPSNEVPALQAQAVGNAYILIKGYRDSAGVLTQAYVDFNVAFYTGETEMLVAMHIHSGVAGTNGPVVIDSGLMGPIEATGPGHIFQQASVTEQEGLDAIEGILANPAGYYVNVHSTSAPPGLIRGQLQRTTLTMIQMTKAQTESIESKIDTLQATVDALKSTVDRLAIREGIVPTAVEE